MKTYKCVYCGCEDVPYNSGGWFIWGTDLGIKTTLKRNWR